MFELSENCVRRTWYTEWTAFFPPFSFFLFYFDVVFFTFSFFFSNTFCGCFCLGLMYIDVLVYFLKKHKYECIITFAWKQTFISRSERASDPSGKPRLLGRDRLLPHLGVSSQPSLSDCQVMLNGIDRSIYWNAAGVIRVDDMRKDNYWHSCT